jgi:hypothetical protein
VPENKSQTIKMMGKRKKVKKGNTGSYRYYGTEIVSENGKYGYINSKTGKLLTPIKYDRVCSWRQNFFGMDGDLAKVQLNGKWECINIDGIEIVPPKYDEIKIYQSENPCIAASIDGKWGFIDNTGTEITDFEYDSVCSFELHRARVKKDGKYGYIDSTGKKIIKFKYEYATPFHDFYNGMMAAVALNGKVGFINGEGKEMIPFIYEPLDDPKDYDCLHYRFDNGFANVKLNGKWGVIDRNNKVVIPFLYDDFLENRYIGWRYAIRGRYKRTVDTKGHERLVKKNPHARTFKDYLSAVTLEEVVEKGRLLFGLSDEETESLKTDFNKFSAEQPRPSKNFIRIHIGDNSPIDVHICSVKDKYSCYFYWKELLDMEVRIEDDLTLSDAEIVIHCIRKQ